MFCILPFDTRFIVSSKALLSAFKPLSNIGLTHPLGRTQLHPPSCWTFSLSGSHSLDPVLDAWGGSMQAVRWNKLPKL